MSGFDTAQFERARQNGAALGTQQFGMLQDLADRREQNRIQQEQLQQRAQQIQFGQAMDLRQMDLAEQRFGLDQQQESRLAEAFRMEINQRAAALKQAEVEKAQKAQAARAYGKVLIDTLNQTAAPTMPATGLNKTLEAAGVQMGPGPVDKAMQQAAGVDPMDEMNRRDLQRMIEIMAIEGNTEGLAAIAPAVDNAAARAATLQRTKWAIQAAGNPELIADPKLRAAAVALVRAGKEDMAFRMVEYNLKTNEQIRKEQATQKPGAAGGGAARGNAVGSLYAGMASNIAKDGSPGTKRDKGTQYTRFMAAAAAAKANPDAVLPDGSVILNNGQVGPDGFIRVQRPDGREDAISPQDFAAMVAPAMIGVADSQAAAPDQGADFDTVFEQVLAEKPNATPEEVAAELERRGFVME